MQDEFEYRDMYKVPTNRFAVASVICGAIAVITFTSVWFPLLLGSLAVIFAVLSRNGTAKLTTYSKIGMICGLIASLGAVAMIIFVWVNLPTLLQNDAYRDMVQRLANSIYGGEIDLDELFGLAQKDTADILLRGFIR